MAIPSHSKAVEEVANYLLLVSKPPHPKQEKHTEAPLSLFPFMWIEKSRGICFPAASRFPPKKICHLSTLA